MSDSKLNLDSLFLAALEVKSSEERAAFLERACGGDLSLRSEVEQLLRSHDEAGSFLETPAPAVEATMAYLAPGGAREAAMNAGLAAAFDGTQALVVGKAGHSVLRTLERLMPVPRVELRAPASDGSVAQGRPSSNPLPPRESESRYQLHGEIARGGMGAVLKGRDTDLGRDLAIKVLLDEHKAKPEVVQRFIEEAQIGGQLQHPGIAPVYELGQFADQRPFFSMKLVKGETLSKLLADRADLAADRTRWIGIFEQICQTMAYAHSRGVLHRDLKPANVMVGAFGEVQVMDWGLAKVLPAGDVADDRKARGPRSGLSSIRTLRNNVGSGSASGGGARLGADVAPSSNDESATSDRPLFGSSGSQTQMGSVMGTPAYMPPEQALGEIDALDERADVFGLGAILCEILTGRPPYVGEDATVVYRMATRGQLRDCFARLDVCAADVELIDITKQCLAAEPQDRPRDAGVMAERISAYIASVESRLRQAEVERAAETARATEALRTVAETQARARAEYRARRLQLIVAVVGLIVVAIGGVAAFRSAIYQRDLKNAALDASQRADKARLKADQLLVAAVAAANREQQLATQAREARRREAELRTLAETREQIAQATLYASQMNLATQAAEEPSGLRRLGEIIDGWKPDRVIRDLRGWEWYYLDSLRHLARKSVPHPSPAGAKWSPDGTRFLTFGHDRRFRLWKGAGEELQFEVLGHDDYVYEASWSPVAPRLATAGRDGKLKLWDADTGAAIGSAFDFGQYLVSVRWSPDGTRLAIKGEREAAILSAESLQVLHRWPTPFGEQNVAWHPTQDRVAIPLAVMDARTGEKLWSHSGSFVEWSPDGTQLATSGFEQAQVLSAVDGRELAAQAFPNGSILAMNWNPQGSLLAFGLRDSTVRVWSPTSTQAPLILRGHRDGVRHVSWNREGTQLATTGGDTVKLWDWPSRTNPTVVRCKQPMLSDVYWSEDGQTLVAGNDHLEFWRRDTLSTDQVVAVGKGGIDDTFGPAISWSETARMLAARRDSVKLVLLDDRTGELKREITHDCAELRSLAFNHDGTRLATSNFRPSAANRKEHGEVCLYDPRNGELVWKNELHGDRVGGLAWSPEGGRLACCGWTSVEILNAEDGRSLVQSRIANDLGWIHEVSWSPDGERMALACMNHTLRIMEARTGREVLTLVGHTGPVKTVSWSPDGQRIASGGGDKSVRIWNAQSGLQVLALRQHQVAVESVRWSPDGRQLVSGSAQGELIVWDARTGIQYEGAAPSPDDPSGEPRPLTTLADAEQALELLARQQAAFPAKAALMGARGSLLARLGRWSECADAYAQITQVTPADRYGWGVSATPMLMAGQHDRYREHCRAMVAQFQGTTSAEVADTVCKTALLLPEVVPLNELPISVLRDGVADPKWEPFRPWFLACAALIAYREGRPDEAIRWTMKMSEFRTQPGTLALVVRAMAEYRSGQPAAARETLKTAELQIPAQLRSLGVSNDATPLPVPLGIVDHDWIVPEILRREASRLIHGNPTPEAPSAQP